MGAIPTQRETASRASQAPAHASETPASGEDELVSEEPAPTAETLTPDACAPACAAPAPISQAPARECARAHATLSGSSLAPGAARALVRSALAEWTRLGLPGTEHLTDRLADDATLVVSELVTNAVVHAGTDVELACRLEGADGLDGVDGVDGVDNETVALVVEVCDHHPSRAPRGGEPETPHDMPEYGRGLRLVGALSEAWGITYRTGRKTVWARLPAGGCAAGEQIEAYAEEQALARGLRVAEILAPEPRKGREAGEPGEADAGEPREVGRRRRDGRDRKDAQDSRGLRDRQGPQDSRALADRQDLRDSRALADRQGPQDSRALADRQDLRDSRGLRDSRDWNDVRDWRDRHEGGSDGCDGAWLGRGALSFLAEASDLLAGQLDEDLVAALAGQLIVPRLADWCAVWLEDEATGGGWGGGAGAGGPRLARVWHGSENRIEELRQALEKDPPPPSDPPGSWPVDYPWPGEALGDAPGEPGSALAYRLVAGGRPLGTLVIGRSGAAGFPDEITGLVEDLSRRVALAIGAARQYARQATISAVLQRGLLPGAVAEIPGVRSALVYEPYDKGGPSGDFYDLFPAGDGRWCFAVGDVQGKGPEAAVVIGLARPWLRLLAREGYRVADVLDRLNQLLLDDATEAADAATRALVAAGARPTPPGDGPQTRFLSLLYGELVPFDGGVRCTVASAGHPLPLLLGAGGEVHTTAQPQTLLGVVEDATYTSDTFELRPGDTLLCVTDGVTERRSGTRQFDDEDGLAAALAGCAGLDAELIAERIKRLVHEFGARPPADDLALLVLQAE
ncbi:SpoIIE family protein phosphatase [Streptomyces violaceus]|uniref:SpoIIE family protein phosphatase n=1 Tax=Streptomyces violaceus TaxID=1936 RepID=UPI002E2B9F17|nr:SpoIIE family protein phosphatase [Streptomyces violaceus]